MSFHEGRVKGDQQFRKSPRFTRPRHEYNLDCARSGFFRHDASSSIQWFRDPHRSGIFPKLSFIGMSLTSATVFGFLAFAIYAETFGVRSSVHYELLVRIYKLLAPLCVLGFLFGLVGVWRQSRFRWCAPACACFTACVWLIGAVMIGPI